MLSVYNTACFTCLDTIDAMVTLKLYVANHSTFIYKKKKRNINNDYLSEKLVTQFVKMLTGLEAFHRLKNNDSVRKLER